VLLMIVTQVYLVLLARRSLRARAEKAEAKKPEVK